MQRCSVCNGRMVQSELGPKCMNNACVGSQLTAPDPDVVTCRCGAAMAYSGEDSWGQPNFVCMYCGATQKR